MPDIPYKPVPSVQPVERATPAVSVGFPSVNFTRSMGTALGELGRGREVLGRSTEQVGAALASLGRSIAGAGDEVWNRAVAIKHVENQTAATQAGTKFEMQAAQMYADFETKMGNAASGGLQAHMQALENARQQVRSTLTNDDARHSYDQDTYRTLGRTVFSAAKHAAAQGKAAYLGAEEGSFDMFLNDVYRNPDSADINQRRDEAKEKFFRDVAPARGWSGPKAEDEWMKRNSKIESQIIAGLSRRGQSTRAATMLDEAVENKRITAADANQLETKVQRDYTDDATRVESDRINNDMYVKKTPEERQSERTELERLAEGDKIVRGDPKLSRDPDAIDTMRRRVSTGYSLAMKARGDAERRDLQTVNSALAGDRDPKGKLPTTKEELKAYGEDVEAAYNNLKPDVRMRVDKILARTAKEDFADNAQARATFTYLYGLASDGSTLKQFLDTDVLSLEIPWKYRKELFKMQQSQERKAEEDPRVDHMLKVMETKGVIPSDVEKKDKETWIWLKGGAWRAIKEAQGYLKRPLRDEDYESLGRTIVKGHPGTETWFGLGRAYYEFEVPPAAMEQQKRAHPDWDDARIRDNYIYNLMQSQLEKLFPGQRRVVPQLERPQLVPEERRVTPEGTE